jgi:hypothetical protein
VSQHEHLVGREQQAACAALRGQRLMPVQRCNVVRIGRTPVGVARRAASS